MNILFFCNANNEFGIGHIRRCLLIANCLSSLNNKINVSFTGDIDKEFLKKKNIHLKNIEFNPRFEDFKLIVFDSYRFEDYEKINSLDNMKIAIDDQEIQEFKDWDLVINFRAKNNYKNYKSKKSLYGLKYFPFDNKLLQLRKENTFNNEIKNLFFYFGETVKTDLDKKTTDLLKKYKNEYNFFIYSNEIELDSNIKFINSANFFEYFSSADLIIHGGGLTKYEASYSMKFNLSFSINKLQKIDTEYLSSLGLSVDMGFYESIYMCVKKTIEQVGKIDSIQLDSLKKASKNNFDDNSLLNISKEIANMIIE